MKMSKMKRYTLFLPVLIVLSILPLIDCGKQKPIQIILISIDALRGDHITPYGYDRNTTPHLSQLVKDSLYFTHAYANGCWTMPSHMSMLTGTLPSRHGVNKDWFSFSRKQYPKLHDSVKTIPQILKTHNPGLKTIKYAKLSNEIGFARGFDINNSIDPFHQEKRLDKLLKDLENHKENNFFFFIHTWMVHAPYCNSHFLEEGKLDDEKRKNIDNFRRLGKKGRKKLLGKITALSEDFSLFLKRNGLFTLDDCITLYDSAIHYVDQYVGKIINRAKQLGIYDDLMIVIVSDHGEHFLEHYKSFYDCHGYDYYEEFIKVPIIIKYPHQARRKILNHSVSLIDLFPTILEHYKIKIPSYVQGEPLLKPYSERKRKYIVSEAISGPKIETKMIRIGDLKYIVTMKEANKPGRVNWKEISRRRLYNIKNDPLEKENLFWQGKFKNTCLDLQRMLKNILKNSSSPFGPAKETKIDREFLEHMKSLGYL